MTTENAVNKGSSTARVVTIVGLLLGAIGIGLQKMAGIAMPVVPPGLVILLVAAVLMLRPQWKWAAIVGLLAGLAEVAGFVGSGGARRLGSTDPFGAFASSWVRLIGIVLAVVFGALAIKAAYSKKS